MNGSLEITDGGQDAPVRGSFVLFSTLAVIIITILLSLILGYLNSVSTVKHCLMLYLYKEFIQTFLLISWTWLFTTITCFVSGNGITIETSNAKLLSYCWFGLALHFLLNLNFMGLLRFYTVKEKVLDPLLPWGYDDITFFKRFRWGSIIFASCVLALFHGTNVYPKIYYNLIGDYRYLFDLPLGTSISSSLVFLLIITYVISTIGTKIYQPNTGEFVAVRFPEKLYGLSMIVILIITFMVLCGVVVNVFTDGNIWIAHLLQGIILGICAPIYIILTTTQLKIYIHKAIKKYESDLINLVEKKYSQAPKLNLFKRSSQIQPNDIPE